MRPRKFLILFCASIVVAGVLTICLAPLIVAGGLRWWAARAARQAGLTIELEKIDAPLLRPVVVQKLRIASRPGAPFQVAIEARRVELHFNLAALFSRAQGRLLQSLAVEGAAVDIRHHAEAAAGAPYFGWRIVEDLLADNFKLSGLQLHVENGDTIADLRDGTISGAQIEAGVFTARELTISSPWLRKTFAGLRGATAWQESRLTLGALTLMRGLDLDSVSIDLSHIGESRVDLEMTLDAFGGKLQARISSDDRGDRRVWDAAGNATGISLAQMSDALGLNDRASGSLHASRFTFRGEAANFGEATATIWAEVTALTWRDRTADTIMIGASLYNRAVQIQQLYVKQRNNQLTLTGEFALPKQWADLLKPDFRGDVSATINDLGDFARLFGAGPSDFAGKVAMNGNINARERKLGGTLAVSGDSLVLFRAPVESLHAKLTVKESRLEIEQLELKRKNDWFRGQASIDLAEEHNYSGTFTSSIADVAEYAGLIPDPLANFQLAGSIDLEWKGTGTSSAHSGSFNARGRGLHPPQATIVPFDAQLEGDYAPDNIFFRQFHFSNQHAGLSAVVTIAKDYFQLQTLRLDLNGKPKLQGNIFVPLSLSRIFGSENWLAAWSDDPNFDLDVTLDPIDLAELAGAITTGRKMSGQAAGKIEIYGTPASLNGKSELHLRDFIWENATRLSADLETRLALGILSVKANAASSGSDPIHLEGAIPLQLEKQVSAYALKAEGPISVTLNFPAIFLAKFPPYLSGGIFHDGILSGQLAISDSLGQPRVTGDLQLIEGKFAIGTSLSTRLKFGGQSAAIEFAQLRQGRAQLSGRGEIDFRNLAEIAVKIFPNAPLLDSPPLEPEDCVNGLEFSPVPARAVPFRLVREVDFRGTLFGPAWTISLSQEGPDDSPVTPVNSSRTFSFCADDRLPGKTLTLRAAPIFFPSTWLRSN